MFFINTQDVAKYAVKGYITGFNTGSPSKYTIKMKYDYWNVYVMIYTEKTFIKQKYIFYIKCFLMNIVFIY